MLQAGWLAIRCISCDHWAVAGLREVDVLPTNQSRIHRAEFEPVATGDNASGVINYTNRVDDMV